VLYEHVRKPDGQPRELRQRLDDFARHEMEAAWARLECDLTLDPHARDGRRVV